MVKEWNEYIDKRKENVKNDNIKANDTNIARQNREPQTAYNQDNITNATLGESKKVSVNKVE